MEDEANAVPTYRIFRDKHGIPQFEPKRGTQALKDALIYSFPTLETELQLMQAALRQFFDSERGSKFVFEIPANELQNSLAKTKEPTIPSTLPGKAGLRNWKLSRPSRNSSRSTSRASSRAPSRASSRAETPLQYSESLMEASDAGSMTTWILSNGQEVEKRRRQPYDPVKRRKVAENRGNACERHRAAKTACDPDTCPDNKLYQKAVATAELKEITAGGADGHSQRAQLLADTGAKSVMPNIDEQKPGFMEAAGQDPVQDTMPFPSLPADVVTLWNAENQIAMHSQVQGPFPIPDDPDAWTNSTYADPSMWNSFDNGSGAPGLPLDPDTSFENQSVDSFHNNLLSKDEFSFLATKNLGPGAECRTMLPNSGHSTHQQPADSLLEHFQVSEPFILTDQRTGSTIIHSEVQKSGCSDDPFMGWASKRASQIVEDYGWVLSHVETL